ncbi:hypothetical protein [Lichenicola sp.]|uniref:hypothetical protein n=1 Tax=Lichenicola sp. TaxID=2804529 RepID=UPI003AFFC788
MAQRTITRAYDSYEDATRVVTELEAAGVPHSDISLVGRSGAIDTGVPGTVTTAGTTPAYTTAGTTTTGTTTTGATTTDRVVAHEEKVEDAEQGAGTGASIGTILGGGAGLLAGIGSLAIPGVGPVVAAGWLIATLTGAGVGAAVGGGAGGLVGMLTGAGVPDDDAHVYAETVRRGGNLVTVRVDEDRAAMVESVLDRHVAIDTTTRRGEYQAGGWTSHDETAAPWSPTTDTRATDLPPRI